jgi:hypothetical protein
MEYSIESVIVDQGYPDPGHEEFVIIRTKPRKNKFLQRIFGNRKEKLIYFEKKPSDAVFNKYVSEFKKMDRDSKCEDLLNE